MRGVKTNQTTSREGLLFILPPDRREVIIIISSRRAEPGRAGQKQGQFSLCFYLPSHIPLFVHFLCLMFSSVVEVCNFHETKQIMQFSVWGKHPTCDETTSHYDMENETKENARQFMYCMISVYHNVMLSLVHKYMYILSFWLIRNVDL